MADDDHGPLALQEILLAGCPAVGVRTGAPFVRHGGTGIMVERLPPGKQCVANEADDLALAEFICATQQVQEMDRHAVREQAAKGFDTGRIVDVVLASLAIREGVSIEASRSQDLAIIA